MYDDGILGFFIGLFVGFWITAIACIFLTADNVSRFDAVCEYKGGEVQGEICIKGDRVIEIDLGDE